MRLPYLWTIVYISSFLSLPSIHPLPGLGAHARYQKHTQGYRDGRYPTVVARVYSVSDGAFMWRTMAPFCGGVGKDELKFRPVAL